MPQVVYLWCHQLDDMIRNTWQYWFLGIYQRKHTFVSGFFRYGKGWAVITANVQLLEPLRLYCFKNDSLDDNLFLVILLFMNFPQSNVAQCGTDKIFKDWSFKTYKSLSVFHEAMHAYTGFPRKWVKHLMVWEFVLGKVRSGRWVEISSSKVRWQSLRWG